MKIDKSMNAAVAAPSAPARPRVAAGDAAGANSSGEVTLSPLAGQFAAGETQPPFDSARVQEIKQAIAEGRFSINAGNIADRLIDTARDLVRSQRRV